MSAFSYRSLNAAQAPVGFVLLGEELKTVTTPVDIYEPLIFGTIVPFRKYFTYFYQTFVKIRNTYAHKHAYTYIKTYIC